MAMQCWSVNTMSYLITPFFGFLVLLLFHPYNQQPPPQRIERKSTTTSTKLLPLTTKMSTTNENIKSSHGGGTDKPKIPFKNWVANGSHTIKAFGTKLSNCKSLFASNDVVMTATNINTAVRDRFKWLTKAFKVCSFLS
jgi:hypothetical protein